MTLLNLLGLAGALALPALLAIHLLRRRDREKVATTLFLLDAVQPPESAGLRLRWRLPWSLLLLLQLLAAIIATLILVELVRPAKLKVLNLTVVVDSSYSMQACRTQSQEALHSLLARSALASERLELRLISSTRTDPLIYAGSDPAGALAALSAFTPSHPGHDLAEACRRVQTGGGGSLILLTDRPCQLPGGVKALLTGSPIPNTGFTGLEIHPDGRFRALLRHSGPAARTCVVRDQTGREYARTELKNGQTFEVKGSLPDGLDSLTLKLDPDAFPLDDSLNMVRPLQPPLKLSLRDARPPMLELSARLARVVQGLSPADTTAPEFSLGLIGTEAECASVPGIYYVAASQAIPADAERGLSAEQHPLLEGLNWSGQTIHPSFVERPRQPGWIPIAWDGSGRTMIWHRQLPRGPQLLLGFDPVACGLCDSIPWLILCRRCAEATRRLKDGPHRFNADTAELLQLPPAPSYLLEGFSGSAVRGQARLGSLPGPWSVRKPDGTPLMSGVANVADAAESDFSPCIAADPADLAFKPQELSVETDFGRHAWIGLLCLMFIGSWLLAERRSTRNSP